MPIQSGQLSYDHDSIEHDPVSGGFRVKHHAGGGLVSSGDGLLISGFTGFVSKDYLPGSRLYPVGISLLFSYDVDIDALIIPVRLVIPGKHGKVYGCIRYVFLDESFVLDQNTSAAVADKGWQEIMDDLLGDGDSEARINGKSIQKIELCVVNEDNEPIEAELGVYRVRAIVFVHGGGVGL